MNRIKIRTLLEEFKAAGQAIAPTYRQKVFNKIVAEGGNWPDWCLAPINVEATYLDMQKEAIGKDFIPRDVDLLAAYARWMDTKIVLDVDEDFLEALAETELNEEIAISPLYEFPYFCPMITFAESVKSIVDLPVVAFWPFLTVNTMLGQEELHILLMLETEEGFDFINFIFGWEPGQASGSIVEILPKNSKIEARKMLEEFSKLIHVTLSSVLYLCSDERDLIERTGGKPGKKRKPPTDERPAVFDVGFRLGHALRSYRAESVEAREYKGGTKAPHLRRAHWHSYWIGPRDEPSKRKKILRWIPPIAINADSSEDLPETFLKIK